jgi:hypothetical protein
VAFPNKSVGETGFSSFRGQALQIQNIGDYSIKFFKIIHKINRADGPTFVYSNFKELGGIRCFIKLLTMTAVMILKHGKNTITIH